jgi:hypothetical protein
MILRFRGPRCAMMGGSMTDDGDRKPASTRDGTRPLSRLPLQRAPLAERHLDAALLVVVRRRKLEQSVLPGVPFH